MKPLTLLLAASLSASLWAQASPGAESPVTRDEVKASMAPLEAIIAKRLNVKVPPSTLKGAEPATREEIMKEMTRVLDAVQPKFRFTPRPYRIYEQPLAQANQGASLALARRLVRLGLAGPVGPLMTGGKGLAPAEFGDALGLFFVQIASYTHSPLPKWTPNIQKI